VRKAGARGSRLTSTCRLSLNPWMARSPRWPHTVPRGPVLRCGGCPRRTRHSGANAGPASPRAAVCLRRWGFRSDPPHQRSSGRAGGLKSRRSPSGALRADLSGRVLPRRHRLRRATRPCSAIRVARRSCSPASHGVQVGGDPRRPIGAVVAGGQVADRGRQCRPPFPTR
jgi:hypothetical protein